MDELNLNGLFGGEEQEIEEIDNVIYLTDDDGNEEGFELLDIVEYKNKEYVVLLPQNDEEGLVVILEIIDSDDGESQVYAALEDDELMMTLFEIFKERNADFFNFED